MMTQKKPLTLEQVTCVNEDELREYIVLTKNTDPSWETECNEWIAANKDQIKELFLRCVLLGNNKTLNLSLNQWGKMCWFSWKCNYQFLEAVQAEIATIMQ
jgi:hypothetical protein